jgi:hypothetical protein
MNFIHYLSFKYKLNRNKPKRYRFETFIDWLAMFFLFLIITFVIYLIIRLLPPDIQENMNTYVVGFYAFLCLISLSTATKKYYKEYFLSPEREILLIAPIKSSQIILARFFIVAFEVAFINFMFLLPLIAANYLIGTIPLEIVFMTLPQIAAAALFFSVITHFLFAIAYFISKGKGLKTVAYSIMVFSYIGVISIIIFLNDYESVLFVQDQLTDNVFYLIFQYPKYLLMTDELDFIDVGVFTSLITLNTLCYIPLAYWITAYCYKKSLLTLSSRDLEKSFYSTQLTKLINKFIHNQFIKKDLLYIVRSPQLFSNYISPLLVMSLVEYRNQFASSDIFLPILVNILSLIILTITLHLLMSDDASHGDLLFTAPMNTRELFKNRSKLLQILSFVMASTYIVIICIFESIKIEEIIFAVLELFILTFIGSRVLLLRIIRRSLKGTGYRYNGSFVKPLLYYFFIWNIPLLILFTLLHECYRRFIEYGSLSNQDSFAFTMLLIMIAAMIYKSKKIHHI